MHPASSIVHPPTSHTQPPQVAAWEEVMEHFPCWSYRAPPTRSDGMCVPLDAKPQKPHELPRLLEKIPDGGYFSATRKHDGAGVTVTFRGDLCVATGRFNKTNALVYICEWRGHFKESTVALNPVFIGELVPLDKDGNELGFVAVSSVKASLEKYPLGQLIDLGNGKGPVIRTMSNAPSLALRIFSIWQLEYSEVAHAGSPPVTKTFSPGMLTSFDDEDRLLELLVPHIPGSCVRRVEGCMYRVVHGPDGARTFVGQKMDFNTYHSIPEFIDSMKCWAEREAWEGWVIRMQRNSHLAGKDGRCWTTDCHGVNRDHAAVKIRDCVKSVTLACLRFKGVEHDFYPLYSAYRSARGEYLFKMCGVLDYLMCSPGVRGVLQSAKCVGDSVHRSIYDRQRPSGFSYSFEGFVETGNLALFEKHAYLVTVVPTWISKNLTVSGLKYVTHIPYRYFLTVFDEISKTFESHVDGIPNMQFEGISDLSEVVSRSPYVRAIHERWEAASSQMKLFRSVRSGGKKPPLSALVLPSARAEKQAQPVAQAEGPPLSAPILVYYDRNGFGSPAGYESFVSTVPKENRTDILEKADVVIYSPNDTLTQVMIQKQCYGNVRVVDSTEAALSFLDRAKGLPYVVAKRMYYFVSPLYGPIERQIVRHNLADLVHADNKTKDQSEADIVIVPKRFEVTDEFLASFPPHVKIVRLVIEAKRYIGAKLFSVDPDAIHEEADIVSDSDDGARHGAAHGTDEGADGEAVAAVGSAGAQGGAAPEDEDDYDPPLFFSLGRQNAFSTAD